MPKSISDAKRLMAASSPEAARLLGAGVSRPCAPVRYNMAASAALADTQADLTATERKFIASFIEDDGEEGPRSFMLRVRLTETERERLAEMSDKAGLDLSEYTRLRLFGE